MSYRLEDNGVRRTSIRDEERGMPTFVNIVVFSVMRVFMQGAPSSSYQGNQIENIPRHPACGECCGTLTRSGRLLHLSWSS